MTLISGKDLLAPFQKLRELQEMIVSEMVKEYYSKIQQMVEEETLPEPEQEP